MLITILVVLLILALVGAPVWPYSRGYGWGPSGLLTTILLILLILWLVGYV
jgi:uncharacterized membrane protein (DUF4010 family)